MTALWPDAGPDYASARQFFLLGLRPTRDSIDLTVVGAKMLDQVKDDETDQE